MGIATILRRLTNRLPSDGAGRARKLGFEPLEQRALLSLTHLYSFNDGTANDSVGNAHGVLLNGASVVNGGLALYNTGVTSGQSAVVQYAQLPADVLPTRDATIEVWYTLPDAGAWSRVLDIGSLGGSGDSYLYLTADNGSGTRVALKPSASNQRVVSSAATDDGTLHMAAVVVDTSAGVLRLYVDGTPAGTTSLNGAQAGSVNDTLAYLGRSLFDADPGYTGLIDEVRIYDHAVTGSMIATHAAAGPSSGLPGDYDGNLTVDTDDYQVWRSSYGSTENLAADGNLDGVVDAADYAVWRNNLGESLEESIDLSFHDGYQTFANLTDTAVELTGRTELHATGTSNPLSGSVVHLDSEDAWLFLDNIKPSEVDADYLNHVRVNGAAAFRGVNVRVVQHASGTVVIPHAPSFQPLEVFVGPSFSGESMGLDQGDYYSNVDHPWFDPTSLGEMNQSISSFKLKRGYMATVATGADGSGFSKVYVAQDSDLNVTLLPEDFDNQIQFIRVLPWRWVAKKGASDIAPETLDAGWHYNWNNSLDSTLDWEYVPIRQQRWWPGYPHDREDITHLLGYNEPDNPVEDAYTTLDNGSVDLAISLWPEYLTTGLRVGSPAVTDGGKAWLYEFMDKAIANNLRVDYIAIHNYQANHSAASLKAWLQDIYDRYHLPIWLTEFNNGANWTGGTDPTYEQNAAAIDSFIQMMDDTPWIERYSIYSRVEAVREMTYSDGSLTPAGQVYHDNASPIGYVQQAASSGNTEQRSVAQLPLDGDTLDTSGFGANGAAIGTPSYVDGQQGQAIDLDGTHSYVQLTDDVASGDEFSFAGWVNWDGGNNWQRVFDFGNDTSEYLFLTPSNGSVMRFAIKDGGAEQTVQASPLQVGQWTHVAVTLGGGQAKLYVNGSLVDTNSSVTIKPSDFSPTRNYLGESQFTADPLFNGRIDDVLVTDYVLTPTQIAELMNNTPPEFSTDIIAMGPINWGLPFSGTITGIATDADPGDSLTYGKAHGPAWLTVAPDGTLSGTPSPSNQGLQEFVVTATDSRGALTYTVLNIEVSTSGPFILPADSPAAIFSTGFASHSMVGTTLGATDTQPSGEAREGEELLWAAEAQLANDADAADQVWSQTDFSITASSDLDEEAELEEEEALTPFETAFARL